MFDKLEILNSFNKSAHSYESAAILQRTVGAELLSLIKDNMALNNVLDLGCGTGTITVKLANKITAANIFGVDIAINMCNIASQKSANNKIHYLCADADFLPLPNNSMDMIFSNMMLQWSPAFNLTLLELRRILKPNGILLFSTLGPGTLIELSNVWSHLDDAMHVHNFIALNTLLSILAEQNFQIIITSICKHYRYFLTLYDLMSELKMLGARNMSVKKSRTLLGKSKFKHLQQLYDNYRDVNGKLPATYELYYIYAIRQ